MNRNLVAVGIVLLIVIAGGIWLITAAEDSSFAEKSSQTSSVIQATPKPLVESASPSAKIDLEASTSAQAGQEVKVDIKGFKFLPPTLNIKKGTTVVWTNQDTVKHNVAVVAGDGPKGPLLDKGQSFRYKFDKAGTFDYVCEPHAANMKAKVIVTE